MSSPFFLKSINQPSNDRKKNDFFSFCQSFQIKKKLYWGPRMTPHKELKASTPQEAQYSSTKKKSKCALGAASKEARVQPDYYWLADWL